MPHFLMENYKVDVGKIVCVPDIGVGESMYLKPQSSLSYDDGLLSCGERTSFAMMLGIAMGERTGTDTRSLMRSILGFGVMIDHHIYDGGTEPNISLLRDPLVSGRDGFCTVSEFIPFKKVGDPYSLEAYLQVNEEEKLMMSTRDMEIRIEDTLSVISEHMTLYPGDLVGIWLDGIDRPAESGDLIECGISKISTLSVSIEGPKEGLRTP